MTMIDKAKNAAQKASGGVKQEAGKRTGNRDLEAEGRKDRFAGDMKNAGEKVKDALHARK